MSSWNEAPLNLGDTRRKNAVPAWRRAPEGGVRVFGLIRLILRYLWLAIIILGVRKLMEIVQDGTDDLIERVEEGDDSGLVRTLTRLHDALHRQQSRQASKGDAFGEM